MNVKNSQAEYNIKQSGSSIIHKILEQPFVLGIIVYFLLVLLNFSCLDNPPYWDDILGLHNQALWLAKHHFNILELWKPEQAYYQGGSNVYDFGIIPWFYGILYLCFEPLTVHILGHLFNMACIALTFGVAYSVLRKFEADKYLALLWCLAALNEPVMSGRIVALGQECPLLCAAFLSLCFISQQKYWRGLLFILIAMLCKMTAGMLAIAFVLWLVIDVVLTGKMWRERLKKVFPFLLAGIGLIILFFWASTKYTGGSKILIYRWIINARYQLPVMFPVQSLVLLIVIFATVVAIVRIVKNKKVFKLSLKDKFSLFTLMAIGEFWAVYVLFHNSLPRYTAFIVFPMFVFIALNLFPDKKNASMGMAIIFLVLGILNINGRFYPRMLRSHLRSGEFLERSREYLDDLWANQAACKLLEAQYFNRPIVAKWPFVQMLTVPEMGYVKKALPEVYSACPPIKYGKVKVYHPGDQMPDDTLYIYSHNTFEAWKAFGPSLLPMKETGCKIIYRNIIKDGWFVIYTKEKAGKISKGR